MNPPQFDLANPSPKTPGDALTPRLMRLATLAFLMTGLLATAALADPALAERLRAWRASQTAAVAERPVDQP